jgi:hypothetical protein
MLRAIRGFWNAIALMLRRSTSSGCFSSQSYYSFASPPLDASLFEMLGANDNSAGDTDVGRS